jgi:hypothetical protein
VPGTVSFSCEHGLVHPRDAVCGGGFQIRKVAADMLNKVKQTGGKGWASKRELKGGANSPWIYRVRQNRLSSFEEL